MDRTECVAEREKEHRMRADKILEDTIDELDHTKKRERKLTRKNAKLEEELVAAEEIGRLGAKELEGFKIGCIEVLYDPSKAVNMLEQIARDATSAPPEKGGAHGYVHCEPCNKWMRK